MSSVRDGPARRSRMMGRFESGALRMGGGADRRRESRLSLAVVSSDTAGREKQSPRRRGSVRCGQDLAATPGPYRASKRRLGELIVSRGCRRTRPGQCVVLVAFRGSPLAGRRDGFASRAPARRRVVRGDCRYPARRCRSTRTLREPLSLPSRRDLGRRTAMSLMRLATPARPSTRATGSVTATLRFRSTGASSTPAGRCHRGSSPQPSVFLEIRSRRASD